MEDPRTPLALAALICLLALSPLLLRSLRNPQVEFGASVESLGALGAMLGFAGTVVHLFADSPGMHALGLILIKCAPILIAIFCYRSFRIDRYPATLGMVSLVALALYSLVLDLGAVERSGIDPQAPAFLVGQFATGLPFAWHGVESELARRSGDAVFHPRTLRLISLACAAVVTENLASSAAALGLVAPPVATMLRVIACLVLAPILALLFRPARWRTPPQPEASFGSQSALSSSRASTSFAGAGRPSRKP